MNPKTDMKKVGLITVCNNHNCGSYLQSFALIRVLQSFNRKVLLLDIPRPDEHGLPATLIKVSKKLVKGQIRAASQIISEYKVFDQMFRELEFLDRNHFMRMVDCIVIGSDTIWDIGKKYFRSHIPEYFGTIFPDVGKISYAASAGNTSHDDLVSSNVINSLQEFSAIGVRDQFTYDAVIDSNHNVVPRLVCDPTLLLPADEWRAFETKPVHERKYILIYWLSIIPGELQNKLVRYAKENGLILVSYSVYRPWCDVNVPANPRTFLGYFDCAESIVTSTFHGTMFSIIFRKQFASYSMGQRKVEDVLCRVGLSAAICGTFDDVISALNEDLDYGSANEQIESWRLESKTWLLHAIELL